LFYFLYFLVLLSKNSEHAFCNTCKITDPLNSITPIKDTEHFMVSVFIDHRLDGVIRVISTINRNSLQPLYCVHCSAEQVCNTVHTEVQIHDDHFGFPFHVSDVIYNSATEYLPIKNCVRMNTFKYNFTVCISNLFGDYNNVLMGVQHVVIYKISCGPDLEKLLKHYETEGILEIVPWPIDQFLNPASGWNFQEHKGDVHYYGQLVTLNECIYRHMYQSKYVLLNDIDEIIMPYKHTSLPSLMEDLQSAYPRISVFLFESHVFPTTQFEESGKFKRAEWNNIPGVNIMEHIYREPNRKNIYNPTKMIANPRKVQQTSVHTSLQNYGYIHRVAFHVSWMVHVREPVQVNLTKKQLFVDKRMWDFEQKLIPNVARTLKLSGLLRPH
uniref:Glycosyltransferase family 92 protein n=1 Tax=Sinocyclocheilus grahami TaxID=75366 RepID=A0A672SD61_SINGR